MLLQMLSTKWTTAYRYARFTTVRGYCSLSERYPSQRQSRRVGCQPICEVAIADIVTKCDNISRLGQRSGAGHVVIRGDIVR
jgi:hypothetical protein